VSIHDIKVKVNGEDRTGTVPARMTLVDYLRDGCGLTGTHVGCEHGICGACTVEYDGRPVRSCLMFAVQADGHEVTTVEGLANPDGTLSVLQDAFCETHALQCGYCTPAMLIAARSLLKVTTQPTDEEIQEALSANICRCTGYKQIIEAVKLAAQRLHDSGANNTGAHTVAEVPNV
jgi:carbon-monoxide dehydrogenase small subunit